MSKLHNSLFAFFVHRPIASSVFVSGGVGVGVNVGVGVGVRVSACMLVSVCSCECVCVCARGMAVGDMSAKSATFGVGASTCVFLLVSNTLENLGNFQAYRLVHSAAPKVHLLIKTFWAPKFVSLNHTAIV